MLNKRGESIVEVIVSLVLFLILLVTVTSMIQTSLGVLKRTYDNNRNLSAGISNIENGVNLTEGEDLIFTIEVWGDEYGVLRREINIPVSIQQSGGVKIYEA